MVKVQAERNGFSLATLKVFMGEEEREKEG